MVIDFTATWCGPCKVMDPFVQTLSAKYTDVEFVKIDVDLLMVHHSYSFTLACLFLTIEVKGTHIIKVLNRSRGRIDTLDIT